MRIAVYVAPNGEVCAMFEDAYVRIRKEGMVVGLQLPPPLIVIDTSDARWRENDRRGDSTAVHTKKKARR